MLFRICRTPGIVYAKWIAAPTSWKIRSRIRSRLRCLDCQRSKTFAPSLTSDSPTSTSSSTKHGHLLGAVQDTRIFELRNAKAPKGVSVELAKDVTSVGWVYQYALVDTTGQYSIDQLRSYQDWYLRYALQTVPGVAEVAPIGGFVRQYQVNVDPNKLLAYKIPINVVSDAIQKSNNDVGGRLVEFTGREIHGAWSRIHSLP